MGKYKRGFSKICRQKGVSTPEEVMNLNMKHLTSNYDQPPHVVKNNVVQNMRKHLTQSKNKLFQLHCKLTRNGKNRNFQIFFAHCSDLAGGEDRIADGCRNFVDTFLPEMIFDGTKNNKKKGLFFRKRRNNDSKPKPSLLLLNSFNALTEGGNEMSASSSGDKTEEQDDGDISEEENDYSNNEGCDAQSDYPNDVIKNKCDAQSSQECGSVNTENFSAINNVPINNVPINNVPINNVPINNVPINNVPINNVPINNVPIINVNNDVVEPYGGGEGHCGSGHGYGGGGGQYGAPGGGYGGYPGQQNYNSYDYRPDYGNGGHDDGSGSGGGYGTQASYGNTGGGGRRYAPY